MTEEEIEFDILLEFRKRIFSEIRTNLLDHHKTILLSFMEKKPEWDLLPYKNLAELPAIKWKLKNIRKMPEKKIALEINKLNDIFDK